MSHHRIVLLLAAALLLACLGAGGCLPRRGPDPERAAGLQAQAESLAEERDFAGAAAKLAEAVKADPDNAAVYLRYGELLEMSGQPDKAADAYASGRQTTPQGTPDPWRIELAYRQGLVTALKLNKPASAQQLLSLLPADDPRHGDLQAVLAIAAGDGRKGLELLNAVRQGGLEATLAARLSHHAALAYLQLGRRDLATTALFQAINHAGKSLVAWDVEQIWKELNAGSGQHH